jgi:hypothetical protein
LNTEYVLGEEGDPIRNMYSGRRETPKRIFISFE